METELGFLAIGRPGESGTEVVVFRVEAREPAHLTRAVQLGLRLLGERGEEFRVSSPDRRLLAAFREPLQRILSDRLQHREARLPVRTVLQPQNALVHE